MKKILLFITLGLSLPMAIVADQTKALKEEKEVQVQRKKRVSLKERIKFGVIGGLMIPAGLIIMVAGVRNLYKTPYRPENDGTFAQNLKDSVREGMCFTAQLGGLGISFAGFTMVMFALFPDMKTNRPIHVVVEHKESQTATS